VRKCDGLERHKAAAAGAVSLKGTLMMMEPVRAGPCLRGATGNCTA